MKDFQIPNTIDEKLSLKIKKNHLLKFNEKKLSNQFDLLIVNSGFELRTIGAIQSLTKFKSKNSIIFIYHPKESKLYMKNLENLGKVRHLVNSISENSVVKEIEPTDPWNFRKLMREICKEYKISSKSKVVIDITSFTRVFIYELIYGLYKTGCTFFIFK